MSSIKDTISEKLNKNVLKENIVEVTDDDVNVVLDNTAEIESKMASTNSFNKYVEVGKILTGMLKDYKNGSYTKVPFFIIATIVVGLLYFFNPFDIVPDFIPGIGYLDDLAVFSIVMGWIETDIHTYLDWKISENNKELAV